MESEFMKEGTEEIVKRDQEVGGHRKGKEL